VINSLMTASFQDIAESDQIRINISRWVLNRVTNAGLGGEIHDHIKIARRKQI